MQSALGYICTKQLISSFSAFSVNTYRVLSATKPTRFTECLAHQGCSLPHNGVTHEASICQAQKVSGIALSWTLPRKHPSGDTSLTWYQGSLPACKSAISKIGGCTSQYVTFILSDKVDRLWQGALIIIKHIPE